MIAVFASGTGSNFEALAMAFPGKISCLACNVAEAAVLEKARRLGIPGHFVSQAGLKSRAEHERQMIEVLAKYSEVRLLVLAGYMRILSPVFFAELQGALPAIDIVNLHPAYPDQYKGAQAFQFAVEKRYPAWGLCVHHVTAQLDGGALIASCQIPVLPWESPGELRARAQPVEHALLVASVGKLLNLPVPRRDSHHASPTLLFT